jgi:O-antigen ligase
MKDIRLLPILLAGYLFLLIFRPYEYWPILGDFRVERVYMLCFMGVVFLSKEKRFLPSSLNGTIIIFSLTLLISGLFSISWDASWREIEDYLKYVIFYFMVILCVRDEKDFRFIILAFIGVMFLYVGKSAWEFFVHGRHVYRMGIARMIGIDITYGDPNSFSATICYSLPLVWAMIRSKFENVYLRRCLWAYGCLALVAIIMTGSRSGIVTALLFFLIIFVSTSRKFLATFVIAIALFFSWQVMPVDLQTRFLSTFVDDIGPESAQQSAGGRMGGFLHGMSLFAENPILGVGPNNYPLSWDIRMNAHNLYGQLLGELGLLGGGAFGILLILMVVKNRGIIRKYKLIMRFGESEGSHQSNQAAKVLAGGMRRICHSSGLQRQKPEKTFIMDLGPVPLVFYSLVAQAIIQTIILMLFKGWGDHNLYRYTWLWIAALTVLGHHFFHQEVKRIGQS